MKRWTLTASALVLSLGLAPLTSLTVHDDSASSASVLQSVADAPPAEETPSGADQRGIAGVAKALHAGFKAASAYKAAAQVAGWASIRGRSETPRSVDAGLEASYFDR